MVRMKFVWIVLVVAVAGVFPACSDDKDDTKQPTIIPIAEDYDFNDLSGIAVDADGNVFVVDNEANEILMISEGGSVSSIADSEDGILSPYGIAVANKIVYMTDIETDRLHIIPTDGSPTTLGYQFNNPWGVAVAASGNLYVNENDEIVKIIPGVSTSTLADAFTGLMAIAVDNEENVYVSDVSGNEITKVFNNSTSIVLADSEDGISYPYGIAVDTKGNIYATTEIDGIIKITKDGKISSLKFEELPGFRSIAVDNKGDLYVTSRTETSDGYNKIHKIEFN